MAEPAVILLVEDNPADVELITEVMRDGRLANAMHVAGTGREALDFLHRRAGFADAPRPDMIILDLNLPGISGRDVLRAIKADDGLKAIPVVVMTTSKDELDIRRAYEAHANCYIAKPIDFAEFVSVVTRLNDFWFAIVKLPKEPRR